MWMLSFMIQPPTTIPTQILFLRAKNFFKSISNSRPPPFTRIHYDEGNLTFLVGVERPRGE